MRSLAGVAVRVWAGLYTAIGWLAAHVAGVRAWGVRDGVIHVVVGEVLDKAMGARGIAAMTIGHLILYRPGRERDPGIVAHELAHVRQYEAWGLLFLPAYLAAAAWAGLTGGHVYRDNAFEAAARRVAGR